MAVEHHSRLYKQEGIYFFTTSIFNHISIFATKEYIDIALNAFKYPEKYKKITNIAYTIMPNHLHWIFKLLGKRANPSDIYGSLKKFIAREILTNLNTEIEKENYNPLPLFKNNPNCQRLSPKKIIEIFSHPDRIREKNHKHQVWKSDTDLKLLDTEKIFFQKVNYIYNNSIQDQWQIVNEPADYPFCYINQDFIN